MTAIKVASPSSAMKVNTSMRTAAMLSVGLLFYELEMRFYFCSVLVPRLKFLLGILIDTDKFVGGVQT
jgi:hypothetical protein